MASAPLGAPKFVRPTAVEVLAAARSLYDDELKPFGRILLKRIRERTAGSAGLLDADRLPNADAVPLIDPKCLRKVCESCPALLVEPAEGREYAVTLAGCPGVFVDPGSTVDPYPAQLWADASSFFEALRGDEARLPCGRYACARVLQARGLPFLAGRSLGEVCHVVQLAISQKRILGYLDGHMVPYSRSEECAKQRCAVRHQPAGGSPTAKAPRRFATWEDLRQGLRLILESSHNPAPGTITLSNVKRLFRSQFDLEVSETVLGHSRVCDLLQDARLQEVCTVQVLGSGQALVQAVDLPELPAALAYSAAPLCTSSALSPASHFRGLATVPSPVMGSCPTICNPFVCTATNPVSLAHAQLPVQMRFDQYWESPVAVPPMYAHTSDGSNDTVTPSASQCDDLDTCCSCSTFSELAHKEPREGLLSAFRADGVVVRNTFIDVQLPTGRTGGRSRSVPRGLGTAEREARTRWQA